jgi:hypothetical protein
VDTAADTAVVVGGVAGPVVDIVAQGSGEGSAETDPAPGAWEEGDYYEKPSSLSIIR